MPTSISGSSPTAPVVTGPAPTGSTGTGLDRLVELIDADAGLNRQIATSEISAGATAADAMNLLIIEAIRATGAADGGVIEINQLRDMNAWIRTGHLDEWAVLHGDDEDGTETGFHFVQADGASTKLFERNAVDTVADGLYHLGFEIRKNHFLNEDGAPNASLKSVAAWLNGLLADELADGSLLETTPTGPGPAVLLIGMTPPEVEFLPA